MTYGTHSLDNFVVLRPLNSMEIARLEAADERATSSLPAPEALRAVAERKKLWPVPFTSYTGQCGYRVPLDPSRQSFRVVDEETFWRSMERTNEPPKAGRIETLGGARWPEEMR
ncbi:hypothetical protein CDV50_02025 [Haematobacter massiliensis]|mgnify:CR=1 FL=1|uniref:Uncharacterized protein n=1 Tax=Haematobacter massiliensis TaxID=195105 RepID=A0A086YB99_9RHOB|nr:hypothetical protein [Haematobacter massiliensis]KFI31549.1 hypothetical protein CN97_09995 [Haematobacter massiliensis]OWJ73656.1 hypothetical protein CDV50_02025 [Haematobacter massiliensis]OWJ81867.1 hypothetical protein CDV51_18740 [Haematobacter massiliensis]QBJ23416.1 hypothetical protein HmaOT1_03545 [Haematobacter massiliensis]